MEVILAAGLIKLFEAVLVPVADTLAFDKPRITQGVAKVSLIASLLQFQVD